MRLKQEVHMISVKEYAKIQGVTVQAVHQQMKRKRNSEKLVGHVSVIDGAKYLDDEAVKILDEGRKKTPIIIVSDQKDDLIADLKEEIARKEEYIKMLETAAISNQKKMMQLEENLLRIECDKKADIDIAIKKKDEEIAILNKKHDVAMQIEKNRKLSFGEALSRFFRKAPDQPDPIVEIEVDQPRKSRYRADKMPLGKKIDTKMQ